MSLELHINQENMILEISEPCEPEFLHEPNPNLETFLRKESSLSDSDIDFIVEKALEVNNLQSSEILAKQYPKPLSAIIGNIQSSIENFKEEISNIHSLSPNSLILSPPFQPKSPIKRFNHKRGNSNHNIKTVQTPQLKLNHSRSYEDLSTLESYSIHSKHIYNSKLEPHQFQNLMFEGYSTPKQPKIHGISEKERQTCKDIALSDIFKQSGQDENMLSFFLLDGDISDLADKFNSELEVKQSIEEMKISSIVSSNISMNSYEVINRPTVDISINPVIPDSIPFPPRKRSKLSVSCEFNMKLDYEETNFSQPCHMNHLDYENEPSSPPDGIKLMDLFLLRQASSEVSSSSESLSEEKSKKDWPDSDQLDVEDKEQHHNNGKHKLYTVIEEPSGNLSQVGGSTDDIFKANPLLWDRHFDNIDLMSSLSEEDSNQGTFEDNSLTDRSSLEEHFESTQIHAVMVYSTKLSLSPEPFLRSAYPLKQTEDLPNSLPSEIVLNAVSPHNVASSISSSRYKSPSPTIISYEEGNKCECSQCIII